MPSSPARARFVLLHSASPQALFAHAAAPFCVKGKLAERPPLLALRQGGIRDELHERAARAGCSGWVGKPVVVFAELPELIAGDTAPLSTFERRALIEDVLDRTPLTRLATARKHRGFADAVDRLFGDLCS